MGIKNLNKLITGDPISLKDLKGKRLVFDASHDIYRALTGIYSVKGLTDKHDNPTIHLSVIFNNICKFVEHDISIMYIFDNGSHPLKANEIERRKDIRNKATEKLKTADISEHEKLNKRVIDYEILKNAHTDVQKMLTLFGIDYIIAPPNIDAEHVASCMTIRGEADIVVTNDTDVLTYGGTALLQRDGYKMNIYSLEENLKKLDLNMDQFIKVCLALGSDFADKTPSVGPMTVIKKVKDGLELSKDQKEAYMLFVSRCGKGKLYKGDRNIPGLIEWMASKNFNIDKLKNKLEKINLKK